MLFQQRGFGCPSRVCACPRTLQGCVRVLPPTVAAARSCRRRKQLVCRASAKSFYDILEVAHGASEREIKSAYRKKALKLHPDVNKAPDAQQRFMEAKQAFEVLSDSKQRAEYDRRLRMGYGSAADWRSSRGTATGSSSSSSRGYSSSGYGGYKKPTQEDNYTFEDLMRDLDKEISSWSKEWEAKRRAEGKSTEKPKSLLEELEMLGEEFVEFLEDAAGVKSGTSKGSSSTGSSTSSSSTGASGSSSSSSGRKRSPLEEFDELWSKYGEPVAGSSNGSTSQQARSSSGSSSQGAGGSRSTGAGGTSSSSSQKKPDDDIDAMLAELKRKAGRAR